VEDVPVFDFWLAKLNQFVGNYEQAEMVRAFISSIEYRQRWVWVCEGDPPANGGKRPPNGCWRWDARAGLKGGWIRAGKRVIEYVGPVVTTEAGGRSRGKYLFDLDGERALDGQSRANLARYINHSCRPNAEAFVSGRRVWIYSKRALRAGEQVTIDYGEEYLTAHMSRRGCKCEVCA
jgi:uncharacterized protein